MSRPLIIPLLAALLLLAPPAWGQQPPSEVQDPLLDRMVGEWSMTGRVMGDSVRYDADGKWVLGHQFLRLRMTDVNDPPEYAAHVYIGIDTTSTRYVAHWLDTSGGTSSTTLGQGRRTGDTLTFRFEYPNGPFRTTFERVRADVWQVRMRSKSDAGDWQPFADFEMRRAEP